MKKFKASKLLSTEIGYPTAPSKGFGSGQVASSHCGEAFAFRTKSTIVSPSSKV